MFESKALDLDPIFALWKEPPRFLGKSSQDLRVETWLVQIKTGCLERAIPRAYWHEVGERFLGGKARKRFGELKKVMQIMHGGKYRWDWKKFKVAMINMGWNIGDRETDKAVVERDSSGLWKIIGIKGKDTAEKLPEGTKAKKKPVVHQPQRKSASVELRKILRSRSVEDSRLSVKRGWLLKTVSTKSTSAPDPGPSRSRFWHFESPFNSSFKTPRVGVAREEVRAPIWLVRVCAAFEPIPAPAKVMSTLAAILITIGGAASNPAFALVDGGITNIAGAIALAVGNLLKIAVDNTSVDESGGKRVDCARGGGSRTTRRV
ncbi:hypothetical protein FA95DRAFT_611531 [Auriscalpium vulgare]|uniref:Uncharacterized protein n=1 Tax=Auriscalpium vulgare TaxID=40419 RepID=A0ACB8RF13_9AGAM|nr:hypothetical protein FA95DRAFT_611531 [Auriscalpium vulgare]